MWLKVVAVVVTGAVFSCFIGCTRDGDFPEARGPFVVAGGLPTARMASVYVVKARSPVRIPFVLTNSTEEEVQYALAEGELYHLEGSLYRDGQLVKEGRVMYDQPPFQKQQVRRLKPKATVVLHYELPYVKVEPGRYELRLTYQIHPKSVDETEYGLTAMKLEQTILLDVRAE